MSGLVNIASSNDAKIAQVNRYSDLYSDLQDAYTFTLALSGLVNLAPSDDAKASKTHCCVHFWFAAQDAYILTLALSGLVNLASSNDAKAAIAAAGALPLLRCLVEHANVEVGVLAVSAVANLCTRNADIAEQLLALGAFSRLLLAVLLASRLHDAL